MTPDEAASKLPADAKKREALLREKIEALKNAPDLETAERIYEEEVFPVEMGKLRLEAPKEELDLLFVTVGGQPYSPLLAVAATPAKFVVLLHTDTEKGKRTAEEVVEKLSLTASRGRLAAIDEGLHLPALYGRIFEIWEERKKPAAVGVDLTGGFKTMSAAAAAAGFMLPGGKVFYIKAEDVSAHGKKYHVNERRVELQNPLVVFGEIRRRTGRDLLSRSRYAEAAEIYRDLATYISDPADEFRAMLCEAYVAYENMRFEEAACTLQELEKKIAEAESRNARIRSDEVAAKVDHIRLNREGAKNMAAFLKHSKGEALESDECRDFISMLLASAERRLEERRCDTAALLAYRALEAIAQRRLAKRGINPSRVNWKKVQQTSRCKSISEIVARYNEIVRKYNKREDAPNYLLEEDKLPLKLARAAAFTLLAALFPDDIAGDGEEIPALNELSDLRNDSILAHGLSPIPEEKARELLDKTKNLFSKMLKLEKLSKEDRRAIFSRHRFLKLKT